MVLGIILLRMNSRESNGAQYGQAVLKNLSARLTNKYGQGWFVETLDKCRKFYRVYSECKISSTVQTKLKIGNSVDEINKDSNNVLEKVNQRLAFSGLNFRPNMQKVGC